MRWGHVHAAELRATTERTKRDRDRYSVGEHVAPTEGPWCRYCPSRDMCPAKVGLLRQALGADENGVEATGAEGFG